MPFDPREPIRWKMLGQQIEISGWFRLPIGVVILATMCAYSWNAHIEEMYRDFKKPRISKLEAAQITEAQKHFWEPVDEEYLLDDGQGKVRHYRSDHCTATLWKVQDGSMQTTFSFHPRRKKEILAAPIPNNAILAAGMGGCPGPGPGCCVDPHPPPMNEFPPEWINDCVFRIWREFPHGEDACRHYQDGDACSEIWITPPLWTRCLH